MSFRSRKACLTFNLTGGTPGQLRTDQKKEKDAVGEGDGFRQGATRDVDEAETVEAKKHEDHFDHVEEEEAANRVYFSSKPDGGREGQAEKDSVAISGHRRFARRGWSAAENALKSDDQTGAEDGRVIEAIDDGMKGASCFLDAWRCHDAALRWRKNGALGQVYAAGRREPATSRAPNLRNSGLIIWISPKDIEGSLEWVLFLGPAWSR